MPFVMMSIIEKQKGIFDMAVRHSICREIDGIVYKQHPYALLWLNNYTRLLYWNKFGTPETVLSKYGNETSAYWYWWVDEDSVADLEEARESGEALPEHPADIHFDKQ